jgi:hypothetical protein
MPKKVKVELGGHERSADLQNGLFALYPGEARVTTCGPGNAEIPRKLGLWCK